MIPAGTLFAVLLKKKGLSGFCSEKECEMSIFVKDSPDYFRGIFNLESREEGLTANRLSPELKKLYQADGEHRFIRANCPSGVRLAFETDSPFVKMGLKYGRSARAVYAVDVIVDGQNLQRWIPPHPEEGKEYEFQMELSTRGGVHQILIHLPHLTENTLKCLELKEGAFVKPCTSAALSAGGSKGAGHRFLFLGDSITQGMTVSGASLAYPAALSEAFGADFINLSVGGEIMRGELGRYALAYDWDCVFVAYGINDFNNCIPPERTGEEAFQMLRTLCGAGRGEGEVIVITPIPCTRGGLENESGFSLESYREAIASAAREFPGTFLIDGKTLLEARAEYFIDGLHPNDAGMKIYSERLIRTLRRIGF